MIEKLRLSEICLSISDGDHQAPPKSEKGVPFVTISNFKNNRINFSDTMYVPESYYAKLDEQRKPKKNDILLSVVGSFGIPVFIDFEQEFVFQRHIAILRPNPNLVDARYLYYQMCTRQFYAKCDAVALGAAQRTISLSALRNLEIVLPSKEEQQDIADKLAVYDSLFHSARKRIDLIEELLSRKYIDTFGKRWDSGDKKCFLSDLFDYKRGVSYTSKDIIEVGGVALINLKNIRAYGGYNKGVEKCYKGKFNADSLITPGSLIMGVTDMTKERRLVGHVAIVPDDVGPATISMDLIKLIPKVGDGAWLYSLLRFGGLSKYISAYANGVNVLHLKPESIMNIEVTIPDMEEVQAYEFFFWKCNNQINCLEKISQLANSAKNLLLNHFFN